MSKLNETLAKEQLWKRGNLFWKCHSVQKEMYELFYKSAPNSILTWLLARQSGKTYLLAILALEQAIKKPRSIVKMVTDTKIHMRTVVEPVFTELLNDCPENLKPEFHVNNNTYVFPNGSQVQLAGTDNKHYEKLRGQKADLVLVDEAGFCSDLDYVIKSVLIPTTTHTGGRIVLASTPPRDMDHDFISYIEMAEAEGLLTRKTIEDNPLLTQEQKESKIRQMGGKNSIDYRREYMCELIKDSSRSVIPEYNEELEKDIVKEWPRPPMFDCYESMDIGGKDLTVVLFAYYDFRADKLIIEDELVQGYDQRLNHLVAGIQRKEEELWRNVYTNEVKEPYMRVSDINYIAIQEISRLSNSKINFTATKKDDNDSAIRMMRVMLAEGKVIIHPRCVTLRRHLKNVKWYSNNDKSKFARSPDDGHYDAVEALKYLIRNVVFSKNPYPKGYGLDLKSMYVTNPGKFNNSMSGDMSVYRKIFNIKKR